LNLTFAHQYIAQLESDRNTVVRDAVFGNVGTIITFRIGAEDAEFLEREFAPQFSANDLVNLSKFNYYIKLMIDGVASHAFSANTIPPRSLPERSYKDEIIIASQEKYGTPREEVDKNIRERGGEALIEIQPENIEASPVQVVTQAPMWEAVCSNCGRTTKIPFQPDPRRPVYCRECLRTRRELAVKEDERRRLRRAGVETQPAVRQPSREAISLDEAIRRGEPERKRQETKKALNLQALREVLQEALGEKKE
jgi:CxxC-x17-CxxC domain-containing protein